MPTPLRLLIAEDNPADADLLEHEVRRAGYAPDATVVDTRQGFVAALDGDPEIILCDYTLPDMTAPDALRIVGERAPDLPLIVVSGTMDEATCVTSLRLGAADYLLKDRLVRLGPAIEHALRRRELDAAARAAAQQRQETVNILTGLVENAVAAIAVRGPDGTMLVSNQRYRRLHENAGTHPPTPDPSRVTTREEDFDVDGEPRTFYAVRFPVRDEEQQVFAVGSILVDITAQKRTEEQLRAARLELQERAEHLDKANAELRELDRLKTEFVASVSHELRTPLTSIRGYAELLLDAAADEADSRQGRMLEVIDRNARRLLDLVEDLLMLSQMDAERPDPATEPVDLAELAQGARIVMEPTCEGAEIAIRIEIGGALPVSGDRAQLERLLFNLLSNAVKFSSRGGTVVVAGKVEGDDVVLTVQDHGIGVSEEELPHLFERFFRSANDQAHSIPGTGLGLAGVREIVEHHGGQVRMESQLGAGSTVTVRLPRIVGGSDPAPAPGAPAMSAPAG